MGQQVPIVDYLVLDDGPPHLAAWRCAECGALYFDRRNGCARCFGTEFARADLATEGTVRSFTIVHRAAPGVAVPYVSAIVDLDGGGLVKANVVHTPADPQHVGLGMRVRLTTYPAGRDREGTEAIAFGFEPG